MAKIEIVKRGVSWGFVSLVLLAVIGGILWSTRPAPISRQISVNGECLGQVEKDKTAVSLRTTVLNKNAGESMVRAQQIAVMLTDAAKSLNDPELNIQTVRFDSYEKNEWNTAAQRSEFVGFETTITTEFSTKDRKTIERILTAVAGYENVFVENLRMFTSAEIMKPALESCVADAVRDARARAESIADADGMRVGRVITISYNQHSNEDDGFQPFMRNAKAFVAMETMAGGDALHSKDSDFSVNVSATFELR